MGLGIRHIKPEMKGTGGGRWMPRSGAKRIANKARRAEPLPETDLELAALCGTCLAESCGGLPIVDDLGCWACEDYEYYLD